MKKHATDLVSLVFGIAFVGIAAWWLISLYFEVDVPHVGWFAALALIAFGLVGVVASLRGGAGRPTDEPVLVPEEPVTVGGPMTRDEPTTLGGRAFDSDEPHTPPPAP